MANALIITSVASMVQQFLLHNIFLLQKMGYEVQVACNFENGNTCSLERVEELKQTLTQCGVVFHQIDFERNVFQLSGNYRAYRQIADLISKEEFALIHCHSPIGGVLGRLAARGVRKNGTRVFYTAHGFHFYKGAPKLNWMVYYPIERFCSRFTDKLITINKEDFELAKNKFKAKEVHYVPGVGIDLSRFENINVDKGAKRNEIGVPEDVLLLLSVGELNENKNHQIVIKALAKLNDSNMHYAIAGIGEKAAELTDLANALGVGDRVHLLGFRTDVAELYKTADLYIHPSFREGLPVAVMEAMASKTTVLASRIRGCKDIVSDNLFDPRDVDSLIEKLQDPRSNGGLDEIFSQENIVERIVGLYEDTAPVVLK